MTLKQVSFSKINKIIIFLRRTENYGGKTGQNKTRLGRC